MQEIMLIFFSRWLSKNHPEIKVWYVIDNKSADYNKLGRNIRTVQTNSFKHYLIYCKSAIRISTHAWGGDIPIPDYYKNSLSLEKLINTNLFFYNME